MISNFIRYNMLTTFLKNVFTVSKSYASTNSKIFSSDSFLSPKLWFTFLVPYIIFLTFTFKSLLIMIFSCFRTSCMTCQNAFFSSSMHPICGAYTLMTFTIFASRTIITFTTFVFIALSDITLTQFLPLVFLYTTLYTHHQFLLHCSVII